MEAINCQFDQENEAQIKAIELLNANQSFFLTGKAGTGKTTFLNYIRNNVEKNIVVLAPTGISAVLAGGTTIHSFFGIPFGPITKGTIFHINSNKEDVIKHTDTIIIDEISMVRCDIIDGIDRILRHICDHTMPFGGKQMVFIGDLYQLDPVVDWQNEEGSILAGIYQTRDFYFYKANAFKKGQDFIQGNFPIVEFTKIYRQTDEKYLSCLNHIRVGEINTHDLDLLNERQTATLPSEKQILKLTSYNKTAESINQVELDNLPAPIFSYSGKIKGNFPQTNIPVPYILQLKVGAHIIFCRNDFNKRWVNGTLGIVTRLEEDCIFVKINNGDEIQVDKVTWEAFEYIHVEDTHEVERVVVGTYTQYPVKLAWAITIHKSQGMTFDSMCLDLAGGVFAKGQLYVALSRIKNLDGLFLTESIKPKFIKVSHEVRDFFEKQNRTALAKKLFGL